MLHIYYGNGKGKTTAAVGLTIRAVGAGLKCAFFQFLKNGASSEIAMLNRIDGITVECCNEKSSFIIQMSDSEKAAVTARHNKQLCDALALINDKKADLLVLDEFLDAYNSNMLSRELADKLILNCPEAVELVLTGRNPEKKFIDSADYLSEITVVRHPYQKGISARHGIEY